MEVWMKFTKKSHLRPLSPWPSNSPDLNPIENVFDWMKRYVKNKLPTSEEDLRQAIREAFGDIPEDHFKNLMDSLENRIRAVVKSNGARSNY